MEKTKSKPEISKVIREARKVKFERAKDFWAQNQKKLGVSYTYYASLETGARFPDIGLVLVLSQTLEIDQRMICHLWAKDQMPTGESRGYFEPRPGLEKQGIPSTANLPLDDFYVFSDDQVEALKENPRIWDVLTLIAAYTKAVPLDDTIIAKLLGVPKDEIENAVEWLRNEGLVMSDHRQLKTRRSYFHLPNTDLFKEIRDINFLERAKDIVKVLKIDDLKSKEAYRTTFSRRITRGQAQDICKHLDDLLAHLGNLESEGEEYYSLAVGFAPRLKF